MEDRQFSTGSVAAPDPFDKHLDEMGFYRKHTARDATCLFRVISEQLYGAQIYHQDIRDICVRYMAMHRSTYEGEVYGNTLTFDEYLAKMSKNRTSGTLTELSALAYRFQRNVFLFEACNNGDWFVYEKEFEETFLVFYTPPKQFDTIFLKSYIESVAFCQSLTYEILYSHVFKLPDVIYAVERMLRDPPEGTHISQIEISPYDESQNSLTLSDGRHFILDHSDETECILKNYLFCHFHNKQFEKMIALDDFFAEQQGDTDAWVLSEQVFASSLPRKHVSCVRQLLDENIKPFSYKVAKALDTHIYRNIEFDVWSDARKNARFRQWSQGDSLQVGIKCLVDDIDPDQKRSFCHIQEMNPKKNSCVVFVETLGENRVVPISSIKTIPSVSWMVPNHANRYRKEKKRRNSNNNWCSNALICKSTDYKCSKVDGGSFLDIHYFTKTMHIPQQYCEYITQPQYTSNRFIKNDETTGGVGVGGGGGVGGGNGQSNNKNGQTKKINQNQGGGEKSMKTDNANNASGKQRSGKTVETKSSGKTEALNVEFEPHVHYGNQANMGYVDAANAVTFSHMERGEMAGGPTQSYCGQCNFIPLQSMIRQRELFRSNFPANLNASPSVYADGSDLQKLDVATVRFFYNLGHEYKRYMQYRFPAKAVTNLFHSIQNDPFPTRQNRYSGDYHHNFHDMGELANDFTRIVSFGGRDQYTHKPKDQSQYHRTYNSSAVNAPKKNTRNYRFDYNKGKRQFVDGEPPSSKSYPQLPYQQQILSRATSDYSSASPIVDPNPRSSESEPPLGSVMPTPQHIYSYHDAGDPANIYGLPVGYGMYPHVNDNFGSGYVPGGMMFSEPLNIDSDLTQTYPYYNPHGTYFYSTPVAPMQMGPHQGSWYPPMPYQSNMPVPIQSSGSTVTAAPPPSTPSYGNYVAPDTEAAPFVPKEP